jgi:uncharacterized membrane protein
MTGFDWILATVCGQNAAHTWAPGGELLPCCQRCTGLYAGALVATILHGWLRPQVTGRFLTIHGVFLVIMVPFGYHWLPQEAVLRTVTGLLFGAGLVTFLMVSLRAPPAGVGQDRSPGTRGYFLGLSAAGIGILAAAGSAWGAAARVLSAVVTIGALALFGLILLNLAVHGIALWRSARPGARQEQASRPTTPRQEIPWAGRSDPSSGA